MLSNWKLLGALVLAALLLIPATAQDEAKEPPTPEEATKDCEAIIAFWEANREALESMETMYVTAAGPVDETQATVDEFVRIRAEVIPSVQEYLAPFAEKYGKEREGDFTGFPAITVYDTLWDILGGDLNDLDHPEDAFDNMYMAVERATTKAVEMAEQLAIGVSTTIDLVKEEFYVEGIRVTELENAKKKLQMAHSLDPNNEQVNGFLAEIDGLITETQDNLDRAADEAKWAGSIGDFAGPGTVAGLEATLLEYFRTDRDWGGVEGTEILAVAVRGQWAVAETSILGQVVRWRLPIHLAITKPKWKADGLARVYELSPVGMLSAGKTPPFEGAWVGDSWMTRITNLP